MNETKILRDFKVFEGSVYIVFSSDMSKLPAKTKFHWVVTNLTNSEFTPLNFYTDSFGYVFHIKGSYNISLEIEDANGNKNNKSKNILIIK